MTKDYLTDAETAEYLEVTRGPLAVWRNLGKGRVFIKSGRCVIYARCHILAWLDSRRIDPRARRNKPVGEMAA
jgi:hypothetical protein